MFAIALLGRCMAGKPFGTTPDSAMSAISDTCNWFWMLDTIQLSRNVTLKTSPGLQRYRRVTRQTEGKAQNECGVLSRSRASTATANRRNARQDSLSSVCSTTKHPAANDAPTSARLQILAVSLFRYSGRAGRHLFLSLADFFNRNRIRMIGLTFHRSLRLG